MLVNLFLLLEISMGSCIYQEFLTLSQWDQSWTRGSLSPFPFLQSDYTCSDGVWSNPYSRGKSFQKAMEQVLSSQTNPPATAPVQFSFSDSLL